MGCFTSLLLLETSLHLPALRAVGSQSRASPHALGAASRIQHKLGCERAGGCPGEARPALPSSIAWDTPWALWPVSALLGHWLSIPVFPGHRSLLHQPGTECDALKICPGLGKTWLGKKPQGPVPMQVDQTLPGKANATALLWGGEEQKEVSQAPLCQGCIPGTALHSIPTSQKGWDGERGPGTGTAAVLQSSHVGDFHLWSQAPVQLGTFCA